MNLTFIRPENNKLSAYIEGYYFLSSQDDTFKFSYYTFPNNFQILSVLLNAEIEVVADSVNVTPGRSKRLQSNFTYNYTKPIKIQYSGKVNELTIYFKPLGLNRFVDDLSVYYSTNESFISFQAFDDYEDVLTEIMTTDSTKIAIQKLEAYLVQKLKPKQLNIIEELVREIEHTDVSGLSQKYNISRQYINRLFHEYLGKSPTDFVRIQRFRKSISSSEVKLVKRGVDSLFYDQSHFVREIKRISGQSPKSFFKNIDLLSPGPWQII